MQRRCVLYSQFGAGDWAIVASVYGGVAGKVSRLLRSLCGFELNKRFLYGLSGFLGGLLMILLMARNAAGARNSEAVTV